MVPLEEPKLLGYFHILLILLTPEDIDGYTFWGVIALVLLSWLREGGTKPSGITISEASDDSNTHKVRKLKEEVDIPHKFASYLRSIGSIDEMVSMGMVTEKVAGTVNSGLDELKWNMHLHPQKTGVNHQGKWDSHGDYSKDNFSKHSH